MNNLKAQFKNQIYWLGVSCLFFFALSACVSTPPASQTESASSGFVVSQAPRTLALLPFDNNSVSEPEKYAPLSKGLAAMLLTDLSRNSTGLQLIERDKIQALLKEIALSQSGSVDENTAVKVGKVLGAQAIAFGSFMVLGETVRIDARIVKVETSELLLAENVMGNADNFIALEQELASKIAAALQVALKPPAKEAGSNIEAALLFSRGVDAYDKGNLEQADQFFARSIAADPSYQVQVDGLKGSQ
nr:hypothetical protein [Desulfobulbaceae bacterium]